MKKQRKILIIVIILTLLCTVFGILKIRNSQQTQIISENASEEKFQNSNEEYLKPDSQAKTVREMLEEGDTEATDEINENIEQFTYEEGKAIIVYESDNVFTNIKVNTMSLFNDYKIEEKIKLGKVDIGNSSNNDISLAVVSSDESSTEELIEKLNEKSWVISAIPNYEFKTLGLTNDEYSDIQWAIQNEGQFTGTVGSDIGSITSSSEEEKVIAIVDTGVDYTNEDLVNVMWKNPFDEETLPGTCGYDFVNNDTNPMDDNGHGTHCAGIVAAEANNGVGISGAVLGATNIKIMALKVGNASGTMSLDNIISAYEYIIQAQELGVNIVAINNSWGVTWKLGTSQDSAIEEIKELCNQIVEQAGENGAISVFAAGNNGLDLDENGIYTSGTVRYLAFPACIESNYEITVAASNSNDELGYFSNYGDVVEIAAPGVDIYSTQLSGKVFNPSSTKKQEYCIYENFEGEDADIINKIKPEIVTSVNNEVVRTDASSICEIEISDEKFYGVSGNALKILVDNTGRNNEINLRLPLSEFGIPDFSTYAISLDIYAIRSDAAGGGSSRDAATGYYYNGRCLVSIQNEDATAYGDLGESKICDSTDYWHHWNAVYLQKDYMPLEYLDIIMYDLQKGYYTIYIDNLTITKDLEDDYKKVLTPYKLQSGTSMAAPYVTASVAVVSNQYEDYTTLELKNLILNGTRDNEKFTDLVKYGALDMQSFLKPEEIGLVYGDSNYNYDGKGHSINLNVVKPTNGVEIYYSTEQELTTENYLSGSTEKPMFTNPGEYIVYWYAHSTNEEYVDRSGANKVTIDKKNIMDAYDYKGNYDTEEHSISLYSDIQTDEIEIYYSTEQQLTLENYNVLGNTTKPMFADAGEYTIYWYIHSVNGMLEDVSGSNIVQINPTGMSLTLDNEYIERELTGSKEGWNLIQLKLNNTSYTYTGNEIETIGVLTFRGKELIKDKDYIVEYFISNYDEDNYPVYDTTADPINPNNVYMVRLTGKGNFKGILPTEEFTIEPRNITIIANDQKILEGKEIKTGINEITIQGDGLADEQVISEITLESTVGEDGQEIIKVSNAIIKDSSNNDVTSNYNISYVDGKLKTLSSEEIIEIQFNDIGLYKSIILGNNIETLYEDEENKKVIFDKDVIEQLESLVLDDSYGKIEDLTGVDNFYNLKTLILQNSNVKDIGEILELSNITEVKIDSSCKIEEMETEDNKMYLPQFLQVTAQTQNNAIITAEIYYGENNKTEIPVNKDENGKLYVILDNKVTGSKPAGDRTINFKVSGGITDGSSCSVLYNVIAPLTNFETIEIKEEEYIVILAENNNNVENILTRDNFPNTKYDMRAIDINGNILNEDAPISTGTKIEILNTQEIVATYNISVKGDIDCDGIIDLYDILKLIELVFDTDSSYIWDECVRLAGKCAEDSNTENPDLYDILRLIEYNFDNVKFYEGEN